VIIASHRLADRAPSEGRNLTKRRKNGTRGGVTGFDTDSRGVDEELRLEMEIFLDRRGLASSQSFESLQKLVHADRAPPPLAGSGSWNPASLR
jgi:hypothetical protein